MKAAIATLTLLLALPCLAHAAGKKDAELALTEAGTAIEAAEHADAAQNAPADLRNAREVFAGAQNAFEHHDWTESVMDSEKARADADLAAARARQHRSEAATAEVEASIASMRR